jgi:hypothetical protein
MKRLFVVALALIVVGCLAYTPALTQPAKDTKSAASKQAKPKSDKDGKPRSRKSPAQRLATCRADCRTGNTHGLYRPYNVADPNLVSPEGRKMYAECVRLCTAPLPSFYVQKGILESGGTWFGMRMADCLGCHSTGKPQRFWPGIITLPDSLRR